MLFEKEEKKEKEHYIGDNRSNSNNKLKRQETWTTG